MTHFLLLTAFIIAMTCLQATSSKKIAVYNSRINPEIQPAKKDRGIFMIIAMAIMMLLAALRSENVGNDTPEYIRIFNEIISNPDYVNVTRFEVGYVFLNQIVGKFTTNPQGILIVVAIIQYTIFIWFFLKHSKNYALTTVLFFILSFGSTLNIVRQTLAMAFIFIAFDRVLDKKIIGAIFWIIIATLFHTSAIVMLVLVLLPYIKFDKVFVIIILGLCGLFAFSDLLYKICMLVAPSYAHYFSGQYAESGWLAVTYQLLSNFMFFVVILLAVIFVQKHKKGILDSKLRYNQQNNLVLWISFAAFAGFILGYKINLVDRLISYLTIYAIIFLPNALQKYDKTSRIILSCGIVGVLIAYSIVVLKFRPEWNTVYPYTFFWQVG